MAFHFKPAITAVEALGDCWRWLRRSAVTFHSQRLCMGLGAVSLAGGLYRTLAGLFGVHLPSSPP
jgi:hypothetical protein